MRQCRTLRVNHVVTGESAHPERGRKRTGRQESRELQKRLSKSRMGTGITIVKIGKECAVWRESVIGCLNDSNPLDVPSAFCSRLNVKLVQHQPKPKVCPCDVCATARKFYRLTAKLPEKDREWLRDFHDGMVDGRDDELYTLRINLGLLRAYIGN
jgi:hypothetical protein